MAVQEQDWNRWRRLEALKNLLNRSSPLVPPTFVPGIDNLLALVEDKKVLVVGAGGLGCEILKDLALSGFSTIEVVDIDTIDLSNLNRQFLFRQKDIGRAKADVAAESIMKRCPWMKITPHTRKIQEFPSSFFEEFSIIIAGLDNVEARRWLNSTLVNLVELDKDGNVLTDTVRPLIDGGTEGFKGQARLFFPMMTSCYECSIGTLPVQKAVPLCTIANVPRTPEHCIAYALEAEWPKLRSLRSCSEYELGESENESNALELDTDNVMHMRWIFQRAFDRAAKFGIEGVTYSMTMKVVKNIVPSIASTNAIISAICVNEALKVCTWSSMPLSNFLMYIGSHGVYSRTFEYERNENCIVCGSKKILYSVDRTMTLQDLIDKMRSDPLLYVFALR